MTHPTLRRPKAGLLALTLELYEQLSPGLREDREQWLRTAVLPALASTADIRFSRAAFRREDIDAIVAEHEAAGVDALVVMCLTYSPSQIALPALKHTRLPILLWNTQELESVDATFDAEKIGPNHGVHGTQDLANVLTRSEVPFHYVTSHLHDAEPVAAIGELFFAAAAVADLRRLRLGLLGYPFPGMGDFAVDTTHMAATLGCSWMPVPIDDYIHRASAAAAETVDQLAAEYRASYAVANDVTESDLATTARSELSLRSLIEEHRLDAMSFQFTALGDDERTETLPFVAVSRFMADGVGFAGEGDLVGAAGTWFLNRLCSPATFNEIFTIDFGGNALFVSHMGEANVAMARKGRKVPLVARSSPIARTRSRQLALVTTFEPGPATLCALAIGPRQRWRLIASPMQIAEYGPIAGLEVPHGKIIPSTDVRQWLTAYAQAGGPHHNAICFGDARARLKVAARLLGADYCEV
jgi:L-arabinose isomerase